MEMQYKMQYKYNPITGLSASDMMFYNIIVQGNRKREIRKVLKQDKYLKEDGVIVKVGNARDYRRQKLTSIVLGLKPASRIGRLNDTKLAIDSYLAKDETPSIEISARCD